MQSPFRASHTLAMAAVLCGSLSSATAIAQTNAAPAVQPVEISILAINDFHGHVQPPAGGISIVDPADKTKMLRIPAGGAEHMATLVKGLRDGKKNTVFVAAGDLISASPFLSSMFYDEPTIEALSMMGLDLAAVGNHEFDRGKDELMRMQTGGCHPKAGCFTDKPFEGAKFQYLAASTFDKTSGKTFLPAYNLRYFDGIPVAFIGLTLKGTPSVVSPAGIKGLEFRDEAETVNALVPILRKEGVEAIVVLIHEGGFPTGDYNECPGISGPIVDIVKKFDKAVDIVVSGHTHRAYTCNIDGRLVTSGDKYGTVVTNIDAALDPATRDFIRAKANNIIVETARYAKDPQQTRLIEQFEKLAKPIADRPAGSVTETLLPVPNNAGESPLGNIIADAQFEATRALEDGAADFALTNPGGIRGAIIMRDKGVVTFGDVFAVQPFRNQLVTMSLTGLQIRRVLERQWEGQQHPRVLQVSQGLTYTWDVNRPLGSRIVPGSITLNGKPMTDSGSYRVTVNGYLAEGGDNYTMFKQGIERVTGVYDVEALETWFNSNSPVAPRASGRINRLN